MTTSKRTPKSKLSSAPPSGSEGDLIQQLWRRIQVVEEWIRAQQVAGLQETRIDTLSAEIAHLRTSLSSYVPWTCEDCGKANEVLALVASYVRWECRHCGGMAQEDWRRLHLDRYPNGRAEVPQNNRVDGAAEARKAVADFKEAYPDAVRWLREHQK